MTTTIPYSVEEMREELGDKLVHIADARERRQARDARRDKAAKLAAVADERYPGNVPPSEALRFLPGEGWHLLAAVAGTKPPSEATRNLVVEILRKRGR